MSSRLSICATVALCLLVVLAGRPLPAHAATDPAVVARTATLIQDSLDVYSKRASATDPRYFADGVWQTGDDKVWAYTQGGPAAACAVLWRYTGQTRADLLAMATATIDTAIATHQRSDGAFVGFAADTQPDPIRTMMFGLEMATAYLALEPALNATRQASWKASLARAADYVISAGALTWYTNGNINVGYAELFALVSRITGESRFAQAHDKEWAFVTSPPQPRWAGWGLQLTTVPARADGADGAGYLTEAGNPSNPGFDAEYTGVQLDIVARLYLLSGDPRALRLTNLIANQLLPRVNADWMLDTSGGTRHPEAGRRVAFTTPAIAVLAGNGRTDLESAQAAQFPRIDATYRDVLRYTSVNFYKGLGSQLSVVLLAAMTADGRMPAATPPAFQPTPRSATVDPAAPVTAPAPAQTGQARKATSKTAKAKAKKRKTRSKRARKMAKSRHARRH
jgi:hypothetical protein